MRFYTGRCFAAARRGAARRDTRQLDPVDFNRHLYNGGRQFGTGGGAALRPKTGRSEGSAG